jgi:hypothetical protein
MADSLTITADDFGNSLDSLRRGAGSLLDIIQNTIRVEAAESGARANSTAKPLNASIAIADAERKESEAVLELEAYLNLGEGWDGYSARTFDSRLIRFSQNVVRMIGQHFRSEGITPKELTPGPAGDGSIDIEVAFGTKYMVLTLVPDSNTVGLYMEDAGESREQVQPLTRHLLATQLAWLSS